MILRGSADDWMLPQQGGEMPTVKDAYKMGGLANMENYVEGHPELIYKAYDKAQRNKELRAALPTLDQKPLVDLSGGIPLDQQLEADKAMARFIVPQSTGDAITSLILPLKGVGLGAKALTGGAGHAFDSTPAEAGMTPRQAMMLRKRRAMGGIGEGAIDDFNPRAVIGGNAPPPAMRIAPEALPAAASPVEALNIPTVAAMTPKQAETAWMKGLPRARPAAQSTDIPDIRNLPIAEATEIARTQPHLIKAGEQSPGYVVGGPRDIQSKPALNKMRRDFDAYVAADPRGADWYDRQRGGIDLAVGGDPMAKDWQSKMHGQWSAGVDPGSEQHFVVKENNAAIAGMPVKAARPAQHKAFMAAIEAKDPNLLQLGDKTGEYAKLSGTQTRPAGATGVNDYRHAANMGFKNVEGGVMKDALTDAQHKFLDFETALAVDRANKAKLGGRDDWTGEKLQAAPWVRQKALQIMEERPGMTYEQAFNEALKSVAEHMPRQAAFATHEAQPGANIQGHMMGSAAAPKAERDAYALDKRSDWGTAAYGRDAIYSGLGIEGTGVRMNVLPSVPMRGKFTNPQGEDEYNIGGVARPLVSFTSPKKPPKDFVGPHLPSTEPFKRTTDADQAILNAGEAVRALTDAQHAGAWHKYWMGGTNKESTSLRFDRSGPATEQELKDITAALSKYGITDIVDTGQGITATRFGNPPPGGKDFDTALRKGEFNRFGEHARVRVGPDDAGYISYSDEYAQPGQGLATRKMLEYVNKTPELRAAFNNNADIGERALARMERDVEWASRWGAPREDIQNLRALMGTGKGWLDRVDAALAAKAILPATAAAIFAAARGYAQEGRDGL